MVQKKFINLLVHLKTKKILHLKLLPGFLLIALLSFHLFSQESGISTKYRPGVMWFYNGIKPAKIDKVRKYDRLIVDLVYNDWMGKKVKPFKNNIGSIGFNSSLIFDIPLVPKNKIAFGIGISYGLYKINQDNYFVRNLDTMNTALVEDISKVGIEKSIFKVHSVSLPLELRFRGQNYKHFKFHIGGKISYQFLSSTVLSSPFKSTVIKSKTLGFYDLNPINASAHVRFGIRNWAFYASYSFLPFFTAKESVNVQGFQFGISISAF